MQQLTIILLACLSTVASPSVAFVFDRCDRGEARWNPLLPCRYNPGVENYGPSVRACWKPFRALPACAYMMVLSSRRNRIDLDPECCNAVLGLSRGCFHKIFSDGPFRHEFGSLLKGYCASRYPKGYGAEKSNLHG